MIQSATISRELAQATRTIVLGGTAVILHGLTRTTKDLDFWTDPTSDPKSWAAPIEGILQNHPEITVVYLDDVSGQWEACSAESIDQIPLRGRMLRLLGADRPIDIFYQPNEVELSEFDAFWNRATPLNDGTRLVEAIDLIITKQLTGRPHDLADIHFLQGKIERQLCEELPKQSYEYAETQFARFKSAETAFSATRNPDPKVRQLGRDILNELTHDGDPFADELLRELREKEGHDATDIIHRQTRP